jgi:subtilase family serine protease
VTPLLNAGYNGADQTIIIIDSFGSPTIAADLHQFDLAFGVPDPPSFTVLAPLGTVPFDPTNPAQVGWAFETTIDVEWAHATAPGASIVLLTSPVDETNGVQGMPEFLYLETYALDHNLGTIISQSWGVTENTLFTSQQGLQVFSDFENLYARAMRQKVTVLAAAGDFGTGGPNLTGGFYSFPVVTFPASSPLVTAVGGTSLYTDADGNYLNETVWNSSGTYLLTGLLADAGGGGVSQQFSEPDYQSGLPESVQQLLNQHRGIPDVAYDSDVLTSSFIWIGFFPNLLYNGWYSSSGTSEASPQWAGIAAIANQFAGHSLGFLNPKLYALGYANGSDVFHDITFGSNAFPYAAVPGYLATPGWDLTSGWGTPRVDALVRALAEMQH